MSKLEEEVALITGGSRGIGAGIAKRFAKEGATVAITYANSPQKAEELVKSIEADGGRALAIKADSADPEAVRQAIGQTVKNMPAGGRIINIGSAIADIVFDSNMTLYALSKTALTGLTKGLARDLGA